MTLYEIDSAYQNLYEAYEAAETEEDKKAILDTLDSLDGVLEVKLENYGKMYKNAMSEYEALKAEKQRLEKRMKTAQNLALKLKENVKSCLEWHGKSKFTAGIFKYTVRKNPPSAVVDDIKALPSKYVSVVYKPLTAEIKKALADGEDIHGAHLESTIGLLIK